MAFSSLPLPVIGSKAAPGGACLLETPILSLSAIPGMGWLSHTAVFLNFLWNLHIHTAFLSNQTFPFYVPTSPSFHQHLFFTLSGRHHHKYEAIAHCAFILIWCYLVTLHTLTYIRWSFICFLWVSVCSGPWTTSKTAFALLQLSCKRVRKFGKQPLPSYKCPLSFFGLNSAAFSMCLVLSHNTASQLCFQFHSLGFLADSQEIVAKQCHDLFPFCPRFAT